MSGITVAIATCGRPDGLARCLAALAAGTRRPDEVLVVDQGPPSTTPTPTAPDGLMVRRLTQERLGLSASRNLALDETRTPILAVTDDDCVPDDCWVETIHDVVATAGAPVLTGPIEPLGPRPPGGHAVSLRTGEDEVHRTRVLPWRAGSGANMAARTDVLRAAGGWDERLGTGSPGRAAEDVALLDTLLRRGVAVHFDARFVLRHEWADRERRLATRWTYGYGMGAFLALRALDRDRFVRPMAAAWVRAHLGGFATALRAKDLDGMHGHVRSLVGLVAGTTYGLRVRRQPSRRSRR